MRISIAVYLLFFTVQINAQTDDHVKKFELAYKSGLSTFPKYSDQQLTVKNSFFNILNGVCLYSNKKTGPFLEFNDHFSQGRTDTSLNQTNQLQVQAGMKIMLREYFMSAKSYLWVGFTANKTYIKLSDHRADRIDKYRSGLGYTLSLAASFPEQIIRKYFIQVGLGIHIPLNRAVIDDISDIRYNMVTVFLQFPIARISK